VHEKLMYQKHVGNLRLELASRLGQSLASIYYQDPSGRFERGDFDLVLEVALAMLEEVRKSEALDRLFLGPFEPVLSPDSEALEEARAIFQRFQAQLGGRPTEAIGEPHRVPGVWFDASEGLELLRSLAGRARSLSAEETALRLVLVASDAKSNGWDLMHRDGGTHLGRWADNVEQRPGSIGPDYLPVAQAGLEAARLVLEQRLGPS
jgi:hypothetical protein